MAAEILPVNDNTYLAWQVKAKRCEGCVELLRHIRYKIEEYMPHPAALGVPHGAEDDRKAAAVQALQLWEAYWLQRKFQATSAAHELMMLPHAPGDLVAVVDQPMVAQAHQAIAAARQARLNQLIPDEQDADAIGSTFRERDEMLNHLCHQVVELTLAHVAQDDPVSVATVEEAAAAFDDMSLINYRNNPVAWEDDDA